MFITSAVGVCSWPSTIAYGLQRTTRIVQDKLDQRQKVIVGDIRLELERLDQLEDDCPGQAKLVPSFVNARLHRWHSSSSVCRLKLQHWTA